MNNLRIEILPVRNPNNPRVAARFQFYVDCGDGIKLECLHGLILREQDRLRVTYPKANNAQGKSLSTWMFSGLSQLKFDESVLQEYRKIESDYESYRSA